MILLKMEQEVIDFIGDNKYVTLQCWLIDTTCLRLDLIIHSGKI